MFMDIDPLAGDTSTQEKIDEKESNFQEKDLNSLLLYEIKTENSKVSDKKKYWFFFNLWKNSSEIQKIEEDNVFEKFGPSQIRELFKSSLRVMEGKTIRNKN